MAAPEPNTALQSARSIIVMTASASVLDPRPRGLYVAIDGTISITNDDADDTASALIPVFAGTTIPVQPYKLTAISEAGVVYGLYD